MYIIYIYSSTYKLYLIINSNARAYYYYYYYYYVHSLRPSAGLGAPIERWVYGPRSRIESLGKLADFTLHQPWIFFSVRLEHDARPDTHIPRSY